MKQSLYLFFAVIAAMTIFLGSVFFIDRSFFTFILETFGIYTPAAKVEVSRTKTQFVTDTLSPVIEVVAEDHFKNFGRTSAEALVAQTEVEKQSSLQKPVDALRATLYQSYLRVLQYLSNDPARNPEFVHAYSASYDVYAQSLVLEDERDRFAVRRAVFETLHKNFMYSCFLYGNLVASKWYTDYPKYATYIGRYPHGVLATLMWLTDEMRELRVTDSDMNARLALSYGSIVNSFADRLPDDELLKVSSYAQSYLDAYQKQVVRQQPVPLSGLTVSKDIISPLYSMYARNALAGSKPQYAKDFSETISAILERIETYKRAGYTSSVMYFDTWATIIHLSFLERQIMRTTNVDLRKQLVVLQRDVVAKLVAHKKEYGTSEEYISFWTLYFSSINNEMGNWDTVRKDAATAAKKYPELDSLMRQYGYVPQK